VVEDDGAERVDEDLLVVADGNAHLAQPKPGVRIGRGELAQREVLLEGDGGELVRAGSHPRSSTPCERSAAGRSGIRGVLEELQLPIEPAAERVVALDELQAKAILDSMSMRQVSISPVCPLYIRLKLSVDVTRLQSNNDAI